MFIAEIVGVTADSYLLDKNGKLCLENARLVAYNHGEYYLLGEKLGFFGYSVAPEDIIKKIARISTKFGAACVCVDVGWGVWLVEGLCRHGINAIGVNFSEAPTRERMKKRHYSATNAQNKRAEMHLDFQDLTDNKLLEVSEEVYGKIKTELLYITSERKSNGKIQIRPKEEIKAIINKSPDELDAVLLSVHAAVRFLGDSVYAIP